MKKTILFFLLCTLGINYSYSQDFPNLKHVKLNKKSNYRGTETLVLKVTDYLFATPIDKKNTSRTEAGQFLIKWMNGTPDYTFLLEDKEVDFFNTDSDLILIYMAGFTKYTLENPTIKDQKALILGTMQLILPYLNKQNSKKSWSTKLWQLNEANQKGELEEYLYH
ncbi:hypothetical protein [Pedobacter sp. Hv1]|uniref:hypothetical protein n=1 Tax=Pedobacter sp. Hv1 TaxID=1740090 RepID=UPI0006D8ADC5|nr:hypothetical protein [Pedobacter sp. Hv1]KQC02504.1 hypothetical protein AQF98_02705 [Pedobacter sp. Hv1]